MPGGVISCGKPPFPQLESARVKVLEFKLSGAASTTDPGRSRLLK